jgi:hypothetical protein
MQPKPGYKSTEFYLFGAFGAQLAESGLLEDPNPYVRATMALVMGAMALAYGALRYKAKKPEVASPAEESEASE